jgi:hypothetical protein
MNQQHIQTLVPDASGQLPKLELVYGCCAGILGVSPEWTGLKMRDDTGEIAVYILSSLISVSDSLVDECMLLVNDSGKSGLGRLPDGTPCVTINDSKDIWLRRPAYDEFRRRTGKDENKQAAEQQLENTQQALQTQSATVSDNAASQPPATIPANAEVAQPLAQVVKLHPDAAPAPVQQLNPPFALLSAAMLDCLEAASVTAGRFVERHPQFHHMLDEGAIRAMATTFFIQTCGGRG